VQNEEREDDPHVECTEGSAEPPGRGVTLPSFAASGPSWQRNPPRCGIEVSLFPAHFLGQYAAKLARIERND